MFGAVVKPGGGATNALRVAMETGIEVDGGLTYTTSEKRGFTVVARLMPQAYKTGPQWRRESTGRERETKLLGGGATCAMALKQRHQPNLNPRSISSLPLFSHVHHTTSCASHASSSQKWRFPFLASTFRPSHRSAP